MAQFIVDLDGSEVTHIAAKGRFFRVLEASAAVEIGFDGNQRELRSKGIAQEVPEGFKDLQVFSSTAQTITLGVAEGRILDDRLSSTDAFLTEEQPYATMANVVDVSLAATAETVIVTADAARKEVILSLPLTAASAVRVGTNGVAADRGAWLNPGQQMPIRTTASVRAYNPHTAAIVISAVTFSG